jgi:hypothetical protein
MCQQYTRYAAMLVAAAAAAAVESKVTQLLISNQLSNQLHTHPTGANHWRKR